MRGATPGNLRQAPFHTLSEADGLAQPLHQERQKALLADHDLRLPGYPEFYLPMGFTAQL